MTSRETQVPTVAKEEKAKPLPFRYQFAAGAVAGISEIVARYPLDVVKTRIQLQHGKSIDGHGYSGVLDCFRKIIKNEGVARLYRGITAPILMEVPKRAIKFSSNDTFAPLYQRLFNAPSLTQPLAILTGASAGATESLVVVPFELLKIRLQDKTSASRYSGLLDCLVKVVRHEGPLALYNGFEATLWRHIVWNAGYFGCIFQVRAQLPQPESSQNPKVQKMVNDLAAGFVGGVVGTTFNTPLDVVKSRIQSVAKVEGVRAKYEWAWPSLAVVAREEGFMALYKGYVAKILRFGPGGGVLLVVYSAVLEMFENVV
ncbi:mitochondrial 2-oxodicarboxylate carrier protein-like protein [Lindgomyces ingoldianus]|uniref:Mitochondrial 2-oxodicarboxylate carrier protein-like protein n=1 Tax=Lindgomyces ingoldianus TaxID=673940 RepID=A0ACB6QKD3_9PLEO|nr:mitochondrial 2-oxodicarboxylate carrier protein-like protein [Lindgomyces ingoldianus]KAF2467458.1 mitochondrial 2-oxodicarboxylate carrier protein-like protein [Lindgomyces ingoldianus]